MENEPGDYLQVPITEQERVQARSRSGSVERLLPQDPELEKEHSPGPSPLRFGSLHGQKSRGLPDLDPFKPEACRYAPISPIDEEDIVDAPAPITLRQRTIHQAEKAYHPLEPLPDLWSPVWLRTWALALFAAVFAVFMIIVIVLWVISMSNDGWHVDNPHGHAAWVYVPTILLVFIVAGWRQVDYHTKSLVPWDELQKGPVSPQKSLLLDYVSSFQLVSLFKAFLHGHIPIVASASSFVLLKIIMIFSTGLFILLPTNVKQTNFGLLATSTFDASSFEPSGNLSGVTSASVYAYYGGVAQNMPFQPGVLSDLAYPPITFDNSLDSTIPGNSTLKADVASFMPMMDCHPIDGGLNQSARLNQTANIDVYGDGSIGLILPAGDICGLWGSINISSLNPQTQITPKRQTTGTFQAVYCSMGNGNVDTSNGPAALLYTVVDIAYEQDLFGNASDLSGGSLTIASDSSRTVKDISNVICKPSYTISNVTVTNDTTQFGTESNGISVETSADAGNQTLDNLSNWNLTTIFAAAISDADNIFGQVDGDEVAQSSNTLFTLMAMWYQTKNISVLLDQDRLSTSASATFKGVMSQYASQSLTVPSSNKVRGTVEFRETRYHVNGASAIAMIIGLAVATCSAIALIFAAPKAVVPRDPNSIAAYATMLTRSVELNRLLRREGVPSLQNQESALEGYEFGTAIATTDSGQSSFKIVTSEGIPETMRPQPGGRLKWWHPITSSIPFAAIAISLPLTLIVVLESVQRSSDRNHGIHSVPDNQDTDIFTHYVPALVMLIIASLVNLIEFNVELFAPWSRLADGNAVHRQSLLMHFLGKSPPFAFIEAVRTRRLSVLLAIMATNLASILTIVVAGLYNTDNVVSSIDPVSLSRLDQFSLKWPNSFTNDNGAAGMLSLIMHQKLPYPDFTYGGIVLPKFSIGTNLDFGKKSTLSDTSSVTLSANQPNLNCYNVEQSQITLTTSKAAESAFESDQAMLNVEAALPENCLKGGVFASADTFQYQVAFSLPADGKTGYGGRQTDLLFGENASFYGNGGEANGKYIADNPPIGCPSIAFTFGEFALGSNDTSKITAMICYQQIYKVDANITLISPTTTIDTSQPPVLDENSRSMLTNPLSNDSVKTFDFRIQENLARQFTPFPTQADTNYDAFFDAALNNGTPSLTPQSLTGETNRQFLYDALSLFYMRYMAQAISLNMRESASSSSFSLTKRQSSSSSDTLGQLHTTISTPRLIQNNGPKLALQILLGLTSALTAAAWATSKFRKVLPCNPCSIAGGMSLLAGSDLCHSVDDGSCECCGKPRRNSFGSAIDAETIHADRDEHNDDDGREGGVGSGVERDQVIKDGAEWLVPQLWDMVFAGKRYSMGWWRERQGEGKRRRFGVDIGVRADGKDDEDWELGKRKRQETMGFGGFMDGDGGGRRGVAVGRGDKDGRGLYYHPGHSRRLSVEVEGGDLGRPSGGGGRGVGRDGEDYRMSGGMGGEA